MGFPKVIHPASVTESGSAFPKVNDGIGGPVVPPYVPPLDAYATPAVAYSIFKLLSTATQSIRVRRSSDNAELDIGFDVDGNLDTIAMTAFVGASSGFISRYYDQVTGGNAGADMVPPSAATQAQIISSGTLFLIPGTDSRTRIPTWGGKYYDIEDLSIFNNIAEARVVAVTYARNVSGSATRNKALFWAGSPTVGQDFPRAKMVTGNSLGSQRNMFQQGRSPDGTATQTILIRNANGVGGWSDDGVTNEGVAVWSSHFNYINNWMRPRLQADSVLTSPAQASLGGASNTNASDSSRILVGARMFSGSVSSAGNNVPLQDLVIYDTPISDVDNAAIEDVFKDYYEVINP